MFYDMHGRPDANGQYELRDGKLSRRASVVLQHGEQVHFDIMMRDAAPPASRVFLTDNRGDPNAWSRQVRDVIRDARYHGHPALIGSEDGSVSARSVSDSMGMTPSSGSSSAALSRLRYR